MAVSDPSTPETLRFSTWILRAALFFAVASLFAPQSEGGRPLADPDVPGGREQTRLAEELVAMQEQLLQHLEERLAEKVASVDRICDLTNVQNQKLQLAGRGDIKRFFDRMDSLESQFQQRPDTDDKSDLAWADRLKVDALALRRALNSGVFEKGSLFAKTLKNTLTADQVAACAKAPPLPPVIGFIRQIDPIAGKVWIGIGEADEARPRTTYDIRKKPHAQQMPGKPDAARGKDAISGTIEVTRVLGENLSEARIIAQDIAHPIAKGDTIVLRRPGVR